MRVNSLPKTATRQRRGCDSNPCSSESESSTLTRSGEETVPLCCEIQCGYREICLTDSDILAVRGSFSVRICVRCCALLSFMSLSDCSLLVAFSSLPSVSPSSPFDCADSCTSNVKNVRKVLCQQIDLHFTVLIPCQLSK